MNLIRLIQGSQTTHMIVGYPFKRAENAPRLRDVQDADRDFLLELYRTTHRAWHEALSHLPQDVVQTLLAMQVHAQSASYRHRFPGVAFRIVCDADDRPAGRLTVARTATDLHVLDIGFLPGYRGRGWGAALIETLQQEAAASNLPLQLKVERGNRAQRLYQRLGFTTTAEYELNLGMTWLPCADAMPVPIISSTSTQGA